MNFFASLVLLTLEICLGEELNLRHKELCLLHLFCFALLCKLVNPERLIVKAGLPAKPTFLEFAVQINQLKICDKSRISNHSLLRKIV